MKKLRVIQIDNDVVQKADLQIGNNVVSRSVETGRKYGQIIKQAVTIYVSPDGGMTITPYQVSPCYLRKADSPKWQLLKLGCAVQVKPGDICSLLHDKCWIKIIQEDNEMEEDNSLKRKSANEIDPPSPDKKICSESTLENGISRENAAGDNISNTDTTVKEENALHETNNNKPMLQLSHDPCMSTNLSEGDAAVDINIASSTETASILPQDSNKDVCNPENKEIPDTQKAEGPESDNKQQNNSFTSIQSASTTGDTRETRRNRCAYGSTCYRKNKYHKENLSHPGDPDYDVPDDRPECWYGIHCYRKNEEHRKMYKHTSVRRQRKNAGKPLCKQKDVPDEVLEDSSEEESIDESEYEPSDLSEVSDSDSGEEEEEEVDEDDEDKDCDETKDDE